MNKNTLIIGFILLGYASIYAQKDCNDAFSAANYSVAHSNNAYEANNTDHVQEWAYKAMETFKEVEEMTSECGCDDVSNLAYEGYVATDKALEQNTWERSRFYAKRAKEKATLMMDALTKCTNVEIGQIQDSNLESREYASNDDSIDNYYTNEDIEVQKAELLVQQKLLEQRQADLTRELEAKKLETERLQKERDLEVKTQLDLKLKAEIALTKISEGYQSLADALGCKYAYDLAKSSFEITKQEINNSNLIDNKLHYTLQLNAIAEKAMLNFSDCANEL